MVKVALLIAVSEYEHGLPSLPGSKKDIQEMERVLRDRNMGEFDDVKPLLNPDLVTMQIEIERLFAEGRQKDDLVLLYFSGHGIRDEHDNLYFATRNTRQNQQRDVLTATAVPAQTIQGFMNRSPSKRQVLILDCCFSGAFAKGLSATGRGLNSVPIQIATLLGGEGRAVLTSSTETQESFEEGSVGIYTRFIVEGIETGAADTDKNGIITVEELHEYAKWKTQAARF
ncbi:caspase domain-containing protein [Chlorogloeopsis fritschii]|uniref:caspase family protein n=1 Tax=Chlorogloeopsis fritschii TaxID=1124 RepID=UPI00370D7FDE